MKKYHDICQKAVQQALKLGATDAQCNINLSSDKSLSVYKGESEGLEQRNELGATVTCYIGQKVGTFSVSDLSEASVDMAVNSALAFAQISPENPYEGLLDKNEVQNPTTADVQALDLLDNTNMTPDELYQGALAVEQAVYSHNGIISTRGCGLSQSRTTSIGYASNGVSYQDTASVFSASVEAIAADSKNKVTDYYHDSKRHLSDLEDLADIGHQAALKTVAKLNIVKMPFSGKLPVVLSPEIAGSLLLSKLAGCISGDAVFNQGSFVKKESLGQKLFGDNIQLVDNRTMVRGLGSSAMSGSGIIGPEQVAFVEDGVLQNLTYNVVTGRKLGLCPKHGRPKMYNAHFKPGKQTVVDLVSNVQKGLYVTDVMGHGFKPSRGDMSFTIGGYVIENGIITDDYVLEATLSGNLIEMLNNTTFAQDLKFKYGSNSPTALVEGVSIS